ncbi:MAG: class I SAM-dependent methyltransferase [Verrucomicrobiae bacterium]|nr:class I SAM-dependent methyltransferase [Verrucomicrobiae bacterium]
MRDSTRAGSWDRFWIERGPVADWDYLSHVIFRHLEPFCGLGQGQWMVEAGCGTGRILNALVRSGCRACGVDNSFPVLRQAAQRQAQFVRVCGDITGLPYASESLDVVWSSGVLEHFQGQPQVQVMKELARVVKPGGWIITLVPYSRCLPYRVAKWLLEKSRLWPYGMETPILTLKPLCETAGLKVSVEMTLGFTTLGVQNLQYLPGLKGPGRKIGQWCCFLFDRGLLRGLDRFFSRWFGGYLLLCVAVKQGSRDKV